MDREKAIEYIGRASWRESRLGLQRMVELLHRLGDPQKQTRFVHVAGTNGKGSVCAMAAGILRAAGYKTGLHTSPYINVFNERIQIDGQNIPDADLVALTGEIAAHADAMEDHPTEFEMVAVLAFLYFARMACDVVVLEVGLGGRLDATNVIDTPEVAVITTIALDHMETLGDTPEKIAGEKAGIIKPGGDVVLYPQPPAVQAVFAAACRKAGARLHRVDLGLLRPKAANMAGQRFDYGQLCDLALPLLGAYQQKNAAVAITAAGVLRQKGWNIPDEAIRTGLAGAQWPARFEVVSTDPVFIVDGGHNVQCVEALVDNLERYFPGRRFVFLTGAMADKDYKSMFAKVVPLAQQVFCVTPDNPRALAAPLLAGAMRELGVQDALACDSVELGVQAALAAAGRKGVVCAFGSFYMAGTIRRQFGKT